MALELKNKSDNFYNSMVLVGRSAYTHFSVRGQFESMKPIIINVGNGGMSICCAPVVMTSLS
jgi:hypothetical protein